MFVVYCDVGNVALRFGWLGARCVWGWLICSFIWIKLCVVFYCVWVLFCVGTCGEFTWVDVLLVCVV